MPPLDPNRHNKGTGIMSDKEPVNLSTNASSNPSASGNLSIKSGEVTWNYIYVFLGLVLSIEGNAIEMIFPRFPCNIVIYALVIFCTGYLFLAHKGFINWLLRQKEKYESRPR